MHCQCVIKYIAFNIKLIHKDYFFIIKSKSGQILFSSLSQKKLQITRFMYMTFCMKGAKPTLEFTKMDIVTEASTFW